MGKENCYVEEIGKKYNHITIVGVSEKRASDGKIVLDCECDCGKKFQAKAYNVIHGICKSCGCKRREQKKKATMKILAGQRFGRLTVDYEIVFRHKTKTHWLCKCDCGNSVVVRATSLQSGNTASCGCYRRERAATARFKDLTGKTYGKLMVVGKSHRSHNGKTRWDCSCECGGHISVQGFSLISGAITSCGCMKSSGEFFVTRL